MVVLKVADFIVSDQERRTAGPQVTIRILTVNYHGRRIRLKKILTVESIGCNLCAVAEVAEQTHSAWCVCFKPPKRRNKNGLNAIHSYKRTRASA